MKRLLFTFLFLVASVGMSYAQDPGVVETGTKGGMSYTFYDNGLLEISGSGALPREAFTNWNGGFGASVKNIRFAEDCEVYGLNYMWFGCYTQKSQLETIEINSVTPIMFSGTSGGSGIFYKQDGAVTLTITAPAIVDVDGEIIDNYGSPVNMIFNMPATTVFEKKWFSGLENNSAVTIPTGATGHIPAGYSFTDPYDQQDYDDMVAHGKEAQFWEMYSHLVEGVDYTNGVESTFEITAENASQIFGQAAVSFQAPTEARNSEWVLWQKSDLKEFPDMSSGDQKVCKDVTVKVNNGVYNTDSGFGVHFDSSDEDGVQFVAPEGKVFKRIVILNEYGTFSDPNWSYDGNYKRWSGSANTVGFVGNICGISLIEFEVGDSKPAAPAKLPGAFTINADGDKIVFSKGNLQATTTDLGANWTWDFAPNQWSLIGDAVANNAINGAKTVSANGTVDLFGWSTAATYYGINKSCDVDDYAGDFVDWGALMGTEWRTLSREEWLYIIYDRTEAYKKHGQATVNGVPGYVLLPDAWTLPDGLSFTNSVEDYTTNQYDGADWTAMESAGAVFLPAAGVREGTSIYQVNLFGWYWASTPNDEDGGKAYYLWFDESSEGVTEYYRWKSKSVRLVTEVPIPPYEAAIKLINAIGTVELTAECKAKIDAAREAYDALSEGDQAQVTNIATLTKAETDYTALNQAEADKVIAKIAAIPQPVELKLATRDSIQNARTAYDALTAEQKALVSNYAVLTDAEAALAALNPGTAPSTPLDQAQAVKDLIEAIPAEITLDDNCVKAIDDARAAYDALRTEVQGALDDATVAKLTAAEDALALLKADHDAANAVIAKINAIGDVEYTTESKALIDAAREAYDALTEGQQALVTNSATLTTAESTYASLKAAADLIAAAYDLNTLIESAQEDYESVPALPKYASIAEQLLDAINTAKGIAENSEATLSELQTAKTNLQTAYDKFNEDMSGIVTNVDKVNTDASESDVWFDLSGRRLQGKPTTPGLYINNGRKAIVK